jgi:hypothetical protein
VSDEGDRPPTGASAAALGVNPGRLQRADTSGPGSETRPYRVVIDVRADGGFKAHSDPEDDLVRMDCPVIPERWLSVPIGFRGDGSVEDLLAEVLLGGGEST